MALRTTPATGAESGGPIASTMDLVGPRLRRVRKQRGVTLTDVAHVTGISKSTLSRLENGQRKPWVHRRSAIRAFA